MLLEGLKVGSKGDLVPIAVTPDGEILVSGVEISGPVTIGASVEISNDSGNPIPVSGPVTNSEMRATPIPVSGPLTDTQLRAAPVVVSGNAAVGAAPAGNPVSCAGVDGAGNKQHLKTDTAGNQGVFGAAQRTANAVNIANGATTSDVIDLATTSLLGFILPAAWTAGSITIEVSADNALWATGGITDGSGSAVGSWATSVALGAYSVDVLSLLPYRYVRFRCGVAQAAARVVTVITRPLA